MTPRVSVIVPNYNYAKTLGACLDSVRAQTLRPVEVIVVDDASTDASVAIARAAGCTVIVHPVNRGVSAARNTGVAASTGDILFFLDSDVALEPDAIARAVRLLGEDPGCGCVYGIYTATPLVDDGPVETYRTLHMHSALSRGVGETTTAVFALAAVPRAVFTELGGFDENLRSAEDDEYSDRLAARYRIRLSDEVRGRHDEADRLLPLLWEQFGRAQLIRFAGRQRLRPGALKINRGGGVLAAALAGAALPAAVLAWPLLGWPVLAVPVGFVALFVVADPPLSRFVLRQKGPAFFAYFFAVHLLVNLTLVAGAATGWLRALVDRDFGPTRRRRDADPKAV
jgi:hypothetical protein